MAEPMEATHSGDNPADGLLEPSQQVLDVAMDHTKEDGDRSFNSVTCVPVSREDGNGVTALFGSEPQYIQGGGESLKDNEEEGRTDRVCSKKAEFQTGKGPGFEEEEMVGLSVIKAVEKEGFNVDGSSNENVDSVPSERLEDTSSSVHVDKWLDTHPLGKGRQAGTDRASSPCTDTDTVGTGQFYRPSVAEEEMSRCSERTEVEETRASSVPYPPSLTMRADTINSMDGAKPCESDGGPGQAEVCTDGAVCGSQEAETRNAGKSLTATPLKIKDEPVDEEYDRALAPHNPVGCIKDEPDISEEFGQQQKNPEELKISAVFSVRGNSNSTAPTAVAMTTTTTKAGVTPLKTLTVTMTPGPMPALAAPAAPASSVRVSCSGCKKILLKGQTAYQRKGSSQLFCSTLCLTGYNLPAVNSVLKKTCHYCQMEIGNPKDVIIAPVDNGGTVKDFCSQNCLSSFDFKRKSAASTLSNEGVTIKCSMCQKTAVIRHEVNYQGTLYKLCSETCFSRFRSSNNLTMNCCENCGGYCYSGSGQSHMLQIEGATKKFCSPSCITAFKQKSPKVTPCTMCSTLRSSAEMIENTTPQGKTELFCSPGCLTAYKVQAVRTSGAVVQCNQCKVTGVPQYHLAMSDGSMRNFCSYNCVVNFQTVFNKATSQGQQVIAPLVSPGPATPPVPQSTAPVSASSSPDPPGPGAQPRPAVPPQSISVTRAQTRLSCKHCCRLFASKPELFEFKGQMLQFCGKTCSEEFKKVNFVMARCEYCKIEKVVKEVKKINKQDCSFCSEGCKLLYKHDLAKRWGNHCRTCAYCANTSQKVVSNHFSGKLEEFCGEACMSHYTVFFYQMSKCDACKRQGKLIESLKWLGEMKHFCNLQCLLQFCSQKSPHDPRASTAVVASQVPIAPAPPSTASLGVPAQSAQVSTEATPVIANVVSLASAPTGQPSIYANTALQGAVPTAQAKVTGHASTQTDALKLPAAPPRVLKNKALLCKPMSQNKGTICKPHTQCAETQTDEELQKVVVLPVPVPIFIPLPLHLYTQYTPFPVGLPLPVPVPMFLPTTLDSAERIVATIQEIKEKIPSDPYEADLILMADMVAEEEEKKDKPVSHGDQGSTYSGDLETEAFSAPHSWADEAMSSAQQLARAPDSGGPATTPAVQSPPQRLDLEADYPIESFDLVQEPSQITTRHRTRRRPRDGFPPRKRGRKRAAALVAAGVSRDALPSAGGLRLHHMYGVNAWRSWVQWRTAQPDMEKPRFGMRPMVLKEDVLQCSTAELSYGLCRFVCEVRRPNGEAYSPDSIFYLCLGIQQHLFENGRLENIFTDVFYSKFISEITKMLKDWKPTILPNGCLHSRVEEEYLWECKQLGAYSPIVLLNTLLFFSTKLFHLKTAAQHSRLSFAHVMRCTKTLKNNSKSNFLRFYPPVPKKDGNGMAEKSLVPAKRKKDDDEEEEEVLEMPENTENPLRCPVRLYEFYLSKCSDSVKQRIDLFYLQPERSCVPNSPLWFSSQPLERSIMDTMLTRILTVREVHRDREQTHASPSDEEASE